MMDHQQWEQLWCLVVDQLVQKQNIAFALVYSADDLLYYVLFFWVCCYCFWQLYSSSGCMRTSDLKILHELEFV